MDILYDQVFTLPFTDALATSKHSNKPLLVYTTKNQHTSHHGFPPMLNYDSMSFIRSNFVATKITQKQDIELLQQYVDDVVIPYVYVFKVNESVEKLDSIPQVSASKLCDRLCITLDKLQAKAQSNTSNTQSGDSEDCVISLRLLDGSSIKHKFKGSTPLSEVRNWLDNESNIEVIQSDSLPSFATHDSVHPNQYAFQSPFVPRITYELEHELKTLSELKLCPRSVLTVKPIFNEDAVGKIIENRISLMQVCKAAVGKFGNVLHSFFNYGVDPSLVEEEELEEFDAGIKTPIDYEPKVLAIETEDACKPIINFESGTKYELEPVIQDDVQSIRSDMGKNIITNQPSMTKVETLHDDVRNERERI